MVFSSVFFLFYFLPVAVGGYFLAPRPAKNAWLLIASLVFYTWGAGAFVLVMLASIAANFALGLLAERGRLSGDPRAKRWAVIGTALVNVGVLAGFKYAGFAFDQLNAGLAVIGGPALPALDILLPIGISFFTFQSMSYVFDVARDAAPVQRNPINFALYVALFPQLIAGPIVRYASIADRLSKRATTRDDITEGTFRFSWGLIKKVVIADAFAPIAEAGFAAGGTGEIGMAGAWIALFAYTLQIYFDFSGYCDMAIGLGRIFGFRFPENFARPYSAGSLTEFWRRWHITLSSWFRDYVYIPLGGSRGSSARTQANLWIVFLLTGLWHGAAWTFIVWGLTHGGLLVLERLFGWREASGPWRPARRALTVFLVMMTWVVFRAESLPDALAFYAALFDVTRPAPAPEIAAALDTRALATLLAASVVFVLPPAFSGWDWLRRRDVRGLVQRAAVLGPGLVYALVLAVSGSYTAFLYFQF
ncbi:MAG: MBOAT family O-acyltransferase [Oceanicaulis sp.]